MQRLTAVVHGTVQGVFFRKSTQQEATRLKLAGWVANQIDGSVRVVAEGDDTTLHALLAFLHAGPPGARVTRVDTTWQPATGEFRTFSVRWL